jgi:2-haloacid dehalogenase
MLYAFDMFGTLADTASVADQLEPLCGKDAGAVAARWRTKQLEYMFRVTAMGEFPSFRELTEWGLREALLSYGHEPPADLAGLVERYAALLPFAEVAEGLAGLRRAGHRLVVFSVGPRAWLEALTASYRELIEHLVSAEDAGWYKPHPAIYRYLLERTEVASDGATLVSSNPWDLIGAGAVGLHTIWCRRDPAAVFDPWGRPPERIVEGIDEISR